MTKNRGKSRSANRLRLSLIYSQEPIMSPSRVVLNQPMFCSRAEFTQNNRLRRVVCRVPPNASVMLQDKILFNSDEEFNFVVHRCHLSSGFYDYNIASCQETGHLNLQEEFEFFGAIEGV